MFVRFLFTYANGGSMATWKVRSIGQDVWFSHSREAAQNPLFVGTMSKEWYSDFVDVRAACRSQSSMWGSQEKIQMWHACWTFGMGASLNFNDRPMVCVYSWIEKPSTSHPIFLCEGR